MSVVNNEPNKKSQLERAMSKRKLKSPIKDKPLRNPGQTLDEKIEEFIIDIASKYIMMPSMMILFAVLEWMQWYFKQPYNPWLYTFFAFVSIIYSALGLFKSSKEAKSLKQGRDGEKAVGQYLDNLREQGAKVFHDIPGDKFNIDHAVICKSGVYAIETKTYSKPDKGESVILFDGKKLLFNGMQETDKPVIQAVAASNWLSGLIEQSTRLKFKVKPVIVFPGWFIQATSEAKTSAVWVLNPKGLPCFLSNAKEQLSDEQVKLIAFHLSRYVRAFEAEK